jgi:hypothetical protein
MKQGQSSRILCERLVRAKTSGSNVPRCSTKRSRAVRNPARISANSWALWLASWVLRLPRSATASVSRSVRKSSTRAIHRGSRSSKWPACSWADHFPCGLPTNTSVVTLRSISSRRAGVAPQADTNVGVLVRRKGEVELPPEPRRDFAG